MSPQEKPDWSATQYLKFNNERTRPVHDLLAQIRPLITSPTPRIYDLGCGPGNSTSAILTTFPSATITGMDSSPDMLSKARASLPDVDFVQGDVATYQPSEPTDLLFSNAVFHWLRADVRIPTLAKLFEGLRSGGVLAIQMPSNYHEQSHVLMRSVAQQTGQPWSSSFAGTSIGDLNDTTRPDLDPVETAAEYYNALSPYASLVNLWLTNYSHILKDAGAIVEWVKGTGLQPYLERIEDESAKKAFLKEYEERLSEAYLALVDGKVILGYPRQFVVAVRK
jgi:trans-aconitate 2-methyltransferase